MFMNLSIIPIQKSDRFEIIIDAIFVLFFWKPPFTNSKLASSNMKSKTSKSHEGEMHF